LLTLEGKKLTSEYPELDEVDVLNPDNSSRAQRWSGHRTTTYEGYLGNEGPTKDTTYEKYLLLAWPAKSADSRMLTLSGVGTYFKQMVAAHASSEAVRHFVQRVVAMKKRGEFRPNGELSFGHDLYQEITSRPNLRDMAPTYLELYPQGSYAKEEPPNLNAAYFIQHGLMGGNDRSLFRDLLHWASSTATWETIGQTVVEGFKNDMEGALVFVQLCEQLSLPRPIWQPFLVVALRMCDAMASDSPLAPPPQYWFPPAVHQSNSTQPALLKVMWDTAMMLADKTDGTDESDSSAAAKLLIQYVSKSPLDILVPSGPPLKGRSYNIANALPDFTKIIQLVERFPAVWEASKSAILKTIGSDISVALAFIKQCRSANLPETVWGPAVGICIRSAAPPADQELNDDGYQKLLWGVALNLPTPTLCQALATRYLALPEGKVRQARLVLRAVCAANKRAFQDKRDALAPLLTQWSQWLEKGLLEMQRKCLQAEKLIYEDGTISGEPSLNVFLASPEYSTKVSGKFRTIVDARKYAANVTFNNSSGNARPDGRGKDAYVIITKTPEYAFQMENKAKVMQMEYEQLFALLPRSTETAAFKAPA
jgi:hypothetical protein